MRQCNWENYIADGGGGGGFVTLLSASPEAKRSREGKACPREHPPHRKQGLRNIVIYESQIKEAEPFYPASQLGNGRPFISLTFCACEQRGDTPGTCRGKEAK